MNIYQLRKEFGRPCAFYKVIQTDTDVITGNIKRDYDTQIFMKAIVLPVNVARKYSQNSIFKVSTAQFPMGGMYDVMDRVLILDQEVGTIDLDDYAIVDNIKYQIESLGQDAIGTCYYLKALKQQPAFGQAVQNLIKRSFRANLYTMMALDNYSRKLGNVLALNGYHWMVAGRDTFDSLFPITGTIKATGGANYKELGLRAGVNGAVELPLTGQNLTTDNFTLMILQNGTPFTCTSSNFSLMEDELQIGNLSWTPLEPLTGRIIIQVVDGNLAVYKNGVCILTDVDVPSAALDTVFSLAGLAYLRTFVLCATIDPLLLDTQVVNFNTGLGRNVN